MPGDGDSWNPILVIRNARPKTARHLPALAGTLGAMEIYLDANATTPVLPQARAAALAVMADTFGNPSSTHGAGLRAKAMVDEVRARARRMLGAGSGRLVFTSGATEGIQTAVLSALTALRGRRAIPEGAEPALLLYGATEHKAVPVALRHWNEVLGLGFEIRAIPVDGNGRHDLAWLRRHAARAGLVCTMAANNETGVVSDLVGIEAALAGSGALWLVDGVQALGKLALALDRHPIDYAPFSGHKLYAPKGIGLLYVREGAPFTPLLTGGGQEEDFRAGTENTAGIAALGAVLRALEDRDGLSDLATLATWRDRLANALREAFPDLVFNAPLALCLPTTLNFCVPGVSARVLLNLFDAAGLRVSGGSACSAAKATPSDVLEAMGLPTWRASNAVRLSFGAADGEELVDEACRRIRACGAALRAGDAGPEAHAEALAHAGADDALANVPVELSSAEVDALRKASPLTVFVDVRELYEQHVDPECRFPAASTQSVPLSTLNDAFARWLALPADRPLVFFCRSGNRSAQAARALRRLGRANAWSLAGGLALLPR